MKFTLHLYCIDKNWKVKGCASNFNLVVYPEDKTYKTFVNPFYGYNKPEDIEVKKKSDILDYIKYLEENGFVKEG